MRKIFSVIFFILFILIFPSALLSFNLKQTVLNPIFYKDTFRKIDFYNRLTKIDPQKAANYIGSKQSKGSSSDISAKSIKSLLSFVAPADLQYTFEKNIDSYLASSAKGQTNFAVDLSGIKQSIASKNTDSGAKELLSQIPDSYTPPQTNNKVSKFLPYLPLGKAWSYLSFALSILFLVLSLVLWPSWKGRLRMGATILLIFGIFILIGNLIIRPINIPANFVADFLNGIARDLTINIKNSLLHIYLIEGLIMSGLGLIFLVVSFFIPKPPETVSAAKVADAKK